MVNTSTGGLNGENKHKKYIQYNYSIYIYMYVYSGCFCLEDFRRKLAEGGSLLV